MKILFLTPWYPDEANPNHGVFVRDQVLALSREHTVWVVSSKIDYHVFGLSSLRIEETQYFDVRETRIIVRKSLPVFNQFNFFVRIIIQTLRIARKLRPDIVHGNIGYPGGFWSWAVSRLIGVPFVLTEHTRIINNFRSSIHKKLTLFSLGRATGIMAVSNAHAEEIKKYVGSSPVVIPNIVNLSRFNKVHEFPDSNTIHFGFLGGLNTNVKGLDLLLQAVASLKFDFVLHIGGDGRLLEEYKQMARDFAIDGKCVFYGFISFIDVPLFMGRLHFFISTSRYESFGLSIVEAMACGLPVVVTDSGGPNDYITSESGIIATNGNVGEIAKSISQMVSTFQTYNRELIRGFVIEKFSEDSFLRQINAFYKHVLLSDVTQQNIFPADNR